MNDRDVGPRQARLALSVMAAPGLSTVPGPDAAPEAAAFDVIAITAGEGNGWLFGEAALRESLPLWEGADCFVDHSSRARSVRDLAGVLADPRWDSARRGIRCRLRPVGPSAPLLAELGRQLLASNTPEAGDPSPHVGFSADVIFTAQGRAVQKIVRVLSVDLVLHPARGGAFLAANDRPAVSANLSTSPGETIMTDAERQNETPAQEAVTPGGLPRPTDPQAYQGFNVLEFALALAALPEPAEQRVRGMIMRGEYPRGSYLPQAVLEAVARERESLSSKPNTPTAAPASDPAASALIQGPGRVHGMFNSEDKFTAALYDLLGAERPDEIKTVRAARLSGIRELYTLMTGDLAFTGGYDPQRASFSTTADLPNVLKNAMNRLIVQEWQELGSTGYRWWEAIAAVEHFNSLQEVTGVLVGEVSALPTVAEGAPYQPLAVTDSAEVGAWTKYGGYLGLTLEMFERDETHRLRQYPRRLASAGLRRISALVGEIFTAAGGLGPAMSDGNPVFGAQRANLGSDALTPAAWEAASAAIYNQEMLSSMPGTPPKLAVDARYLVVPRALRLTARQILYPNWEREANIVSENMQRGAPGDVITCPEMTDPNDWAAVADPRLAPGIIIAERFGLLPEIIIADGARHGALFTNDEVRMKARHWLAVFVADHRPLYKSNVI